MKATLLPSLWRPGSRKQVGPSESLPAIWFSFAGSASPAEASYQDVLGVPASNIMIVSAGADGLSRVYVPETPVTIVEDRLIAQALKL